MNYFQLLPSHLLSSLGAYFSLEMLPVLEPLIPNVFAAKLHSEFNVRNTYPKTEYLLLRSQKLRCQSMRLRHRKRRIVEQLETELANKITLLRREHRKLKNSRIKELEQQMQEHTEEMDLICRLSPTTIHE